MEGEAVKYLTWNFKLHGGCGAALVQMDGQMTQMWSWKMHIVFPVLSLLLTD